jgi:heme exporter protein C
MKWDFVLIALGVALVAIGHYMGLVVAPPEAMMGEVGRILYVHVPTAWVALCTYLVAFILAIGSLWTGRYSWDAKLEGAVEVGVVLNALLLCQGSIWARPTWGVWWTWDPRLTTSAVMVLSFGAVLLLRHLIEDPKRRLTVSAITTIVAFVNVPIVYMSVKWWRTLHQPFSSPDTVENTMVLPLRIAAFGMLFLSWGLIWARSKLAEARLEAETSAPDLPADIGQVILPGEES